MCKSAKFARPCNLCSARPAVRRPNGKILTGLWNQIPLRIIASQCFVCFLYHFERDSGQTSLIASYQLPSITYFLFYNFPTPTYPTTPLHLPFYLSIFTIPHSKSPSFTLLLTSSLLYFLSALASNLSRTIMKYLVLYCFLSFPIGISFLSFDLSVPAPRLQEIIHQSCRNHSFPSSLPFLSTSLLPSFLSLVSTSSPSIFSSTISPSFCLSFYHLPNSPPYPPSPSLTFRPSS